MSGNRKDCIDSGFRSLLIANFYAKRKYKVDDIAQKMGIHKDTLYKWIAGRDSNGEARHFPIDRIPDLVNATNDIEYLEYLCRPCGMMIIPEITDRTTLKMFTHMVGVLQSVTNGKKDE